MKVSDFDRIIQLGVQMDQVGSVAETDEEGNEIDNAEFVKEHSELINEVEMTYMAHLKEIFRRLWEMDVE